MEPNVVGALVGVFGTLLVSTLVTSFAGLVKSHLSLTRDVSIITVKLTAVDELKARMQVLEERMNRRGEVMASRALESFIDPNPITDEELAVFSKQRQYGVRALSDAEELTAIQALDREWETGHITEAKKGDAIRLLSVLNEDRQRRLSERREFSTLPPLPTPQHQPSVREILWPWSKKKS